MPSPISLLVEMEIWISTFLSYEVIHDCLGITGGEHLQLIVMAEIVKVPYCKSNLVITTVPLQHTVHYLVFADSRNLHMHNLCFLLISHFSVRTQETRKGLVESSDGCVR
jgi:hypothetical protein